MTDVLLIAAVFLGGLFLLYALGVPVGFAMVLAGVFGWLVFDTVNYAVISNQLLFGLDSFPYLAIPFYVFLGRLMNAMGLTKRIFRFAASIVGQFRGGIAYINIVASMFFAGMSGLATADVAGLGRIEYTAMRDYDYSKSTALGVTGMSSLIGPIADLLVEPFPNREQEPVESDVVRNVGVADRAEEEGIVGLDSVKSVVGHHRPLLKVAFASPIVLGGTDGEAVVVGYVLDQRKHCVDNFWTDTVAFDDADVVCHRRLFLPERFEDRFVDLHA